MKKQLLLLAIAIFVSSYAQSQTLTAQPYSLTISETAPYYLLKLGASGETTCEIKSTDPQLSAKLTTIMQASAGKPMKNLLVVIDGGECKSVMVEQ